MRSIIVLLTDIISAVNFERVFVFWGSLFTRGLRFLGDCDCDQLYLIFVCVTKRMAFEAYNTITELP